MILSRMQFVHGKAARTARTVLFFQWLDHGSVSDACDRRLRSAVRASTVHTLRSHCSTHDRTGSTATEVLTGPRVSASPGATLAKLHGTRPTDAHMTRRHHAPKYHAALTAGLTGKRWRGRGLEG